MSEPPACVLVVDDEPALVKALEVNLSARHYTPVTAGTGAGALEAMTRRHIDVVLLDMGLPDMDGIQVIEGIRGWSKVPIIVLSARHSSDDKVEALDAGADDYITKPFGMAELLARLRAALRRGTSQPGTPVVQAGGVRIDLATTTVEKNGERIHLTPTEWRLLEVLTRSAGALVTQTRLLSEVWGPGYEGQSHYLRVYLASLRRKLEEEPGHPRVLLTEPGLGYRLVGVAEQAG